MLFYKAGHRGTRGLMPENSIPAMIKGIEAGANTIEFDVHITRDGQVVVYHDDALDPAYTSMPDGTEIREQYTLYKMDYSRIRQFVIGEKAYPAFPEQQRLKTYAPLLSELINAVEAYTKGLYYLLEIKSSAETDGSEHPTPEEYIDKLMAVKELKALGNRLIVQSFDKRPLQLMHQQYPEIALGFLSEEEDVRPDQLGFSPAFFNPYYSFVTPELLAHCHAKQIKVIPWTVQDVADMKRLKEMGVDGIITDYPNRFKDAGL